MDPLAGKVHKGSMSTGSFDRTTFHSVLVILAAAVGLQAQSKVAPELLRADPRGMVNVIVQYRTEPSDLLHQRIIAQGGTFRGSFDIIRSAAYAVPASALRLLQEDPEVVHISADHQLHGLLDLTADAVGASSAWNANWTGAGVGVAVIDSGIADHPDLGSRVVYKQDFVGGGTDDHYGHGEHVAGIVAGSGHASSCPKCTRVFKGMAPAANLINLRVLDQNGAGTDSTVISAIQQAIALKAKYNIRVINLSLGRAIYESYTLDPLCQAVEAAWKAGIVVVVAAGNNGRDNSAGTQGYGTIMAPGNDPYVITVGAMKTMGTPTRNDDLVASYSSKGPTLIDHIVKPDIMAPGNRVDSLLAPTSHFTQLYPQNVVPLSYYETTNQNHDSVQYFTLSGTSMATPVVSGAAADLLQAQPSLTPDQVKAKLMLTAYKSFPASSVATDPDTGLTYTSYYDIFTIGAGYLDINALLADQTLPQGTAHSPKAVFNALTANVTLSTAATDVWNSQALWGSRAVWHTSGPDALLAVWGTSVLDTSEDVFGTRAVWKTNTTCGFSVLWATTSIWAQTSADATELARIAIRGEN